MSEKPRRVQLSRKKGWRMPPNTVKVDRTTKWGNPARPGHAFMGLTVRDPRHAASLYHGFAPQNERLVAAAHEELAGKNLACWCHLCDLHRDGKPLLEDCPYCDRCHADVLLELANTTTEGNGQ